MSTSPAASNSPEGGHVSQDISEDDKARLYGPAQVVFLDPEKTTVEIADDRYGLFLVVSDGDVMVHLELPREVRPSG